MKKTRALILIIITMLAFSACGSTAGDTDTVENTSYDDFIEAMTQIKGYGDITSAMELPVHSAYYYSMAGAGAGSLRFAVEYILWLKGEGESFDAFTSGSPYTGWDTIAELNYASPYPYYFEGLLLEIQGESGDDCYANSVLTPLFPEEGLNFGYLKNTGVEELYDLRNRLLALEGEIYEVYTPDITGFTRDWKNCDSAYLRSLSEEALGAGDYAAALETARIALRGDPFDSVNWNNAMACALFAGEWEEMGAYLDEGLTVFPDDENLLAMKQAITDASGELSEG